MSRLYDRVMAHGCAPLTFWHLLADAPGDHLAGRQAIEEFLEGELGRSPSDAEVEEVVTRDRVVHESQVLDEPEFDAADFEDAVIVSSEDTADFWAMLPPETHIADILDRLAPPFERTFIEFQGRPNTFHLHAWGVLIHGISTGEPVAVLDSQGLVFDDQAWELTCSLVGEWEKGKPIGPFRNWVIPLDSSGYPYRGEGDRQGAFFANASDFSFAGEEPPEDIGFAGALNKLLAPALLAVSLMHCKNVDVRPVDPPDRLSRKHQRKHRRPLTRYYVLDIQPMRRVLVTEGEAQSMGLRHAMHICRGHFKTYTEESPLFGRHTGTYWWESQVRGKAEEGLVLKDYRIRLGEGPARDYDDDLGRDYVEATSTRRSRPVLPSTTASTPTSAGAA